ncbi:MAG: Ig-like domain-containing protein [Clostridia bacterium]|nr:Ig-like domain-containing protein [Clostridia bacterium]
MIRKIKRLLGFVLVLLFCVLICACNVPEGENENKIEVESVVLSTTELEMSVGGEFILVANVKPDDASDKTLTWYSSNDSVATVVNGRVSGVSVGTAVITAMSLNGKCSSCFVCVVDNVVTAENISFNKTEINCFVGDETILEVNFEPINSTNRTLTWTSSNENIASVLNGKVVAKASGTAEIRATTDNGIYATCIFNVSNRIVEVESVSLNFEYYECYVGDGVSLVCSVLPSNASNTTIVWSSSNESVAIVSAGTVVAVGKGVAVISAESMNGKIDSCTIVVGEISNSGSGGNEDLGGGDNTSGDNTGGDNTGGDDIGGDNDNVEEEPGDDIIIENKVSGVLLDKSEVNCYVGDTIKLTATILPENADNKRCSWDVLDSSVASVEEGEIVALNVGQTVIKVLTEDGGFCAECIINVVELNTFSATISDEIFVYDGTVKCLLVSGAPSDTKIEYINNDKTEVGEYVVSAKLEKYGYETTIITGVLRIVKPSYNINYVVGYTEVENPNPKEYQTFVGLELLPIVSALYDFDGWYLDSEYRNPISKISSEIYEDVTVYAKLSNRYLVEGNVLVGVSDYLKYNVDELTLPNFINGIPLCEIGASVFSESNIKTIIIPSNVEKIGANAFDYSVLEHVVFEQNSKLKEIGDFAFCYTNIETIVIPSQVERVGDSAFAECRNLREVKFSDGIYQCDIGGFAFGYCTSLKEIVLPFGVKTIGHYAFNGCLALESVYIPNSVERVGSMLFAECTQGKDLVVNIQFSKIPSSWLKDWCGIDATLNLGVS